MNKRGFISTINGVLGDIRRANHAVETYERLNAMSDARLAQRGIAREDVVSAAYEAAFAKYRD
jgi:hypothetical protein